MRYVFGKIYLGNFFDNTSSSNWNNSGNWIEGVVPNGVDAEASLSMNNNSNRVVTLDTNVTLGRLVILSETYSNTVASSGSNKLTFQTSTNNASIYLQGTIQNKPNIQPSLVINTDLDVIQPNEGGFSILTEGTIEATNKRITKYGKGAIAIDGGGSEVGNNPNWDGGYLSIKEGQVSIRYGSDTLGGSAGPEIELYLGSHSSSCDLHFESFSAFPTEYSIPNNFSFIRNEDSFSHTGRIFTSGFPVAGQSIKFVGDWSGDLNPDGYNNIKQIVLRGTNSYHPIDTRGFFLDNDLSSLTSTGTSGYPILYSMAGGPVKFNSSITFPSSGLILQAGYSIAQIDSYGDSGFVSNFSTTLPIRETRLETSNSSNRLATSPVIGTSHDSGLTTWEGDVKVNYNNGLSRIPAFLHTEGTSICSFSGTFSGNGSNQPLVKTGSGSIRFQATNTLENCKISVIGGNLELCGSFTASDNELSLGNPITRINLSAPLISGDTLRITINGVNYTQLFTDTSDNTLKLMAIQLSKVGVVLSSYVTLVSNDFTSNEEREIVIVPFSVMGFNSVSTGRTGPGNANISRTTSFPEAILSGKGSFNGLVTLADSNGVGIEPFDFDENTPQTLTFGSLILRSNSYISIYFEDSVNSKIQVNGNITLNGTVDLLDSDYLLAGTYDIITYTGTLTDNTLEIGYVGNNLSAEINIDTVNKKIQVIVS
jgi:hypothetical protein